MNLQNAIKLREQLLSLPGKFDYSSYAYLINAEGKRDRTISAVVSHPCETHACVAGWCALLNNPNVEELRYISYASGWSSNFLELTPDERAFLFYPWEMNYIEGYDGKDTGNLDYDLDDAIARLDFLINCYTPKD
jgi:hypothetical protein